MSQRKVGDGHICPKRPIDAHMSQEKAGSGQLGPGMTRSPEANCAVFVLKYAYVWLERALHEYHPSFPCNQAAGVGNKRLYGRLRPSLGLYGPPWAVMGLCGPLCASLGIPGPLLASLPGLIWASMAHFWASLGLYWPLWHSLANPPSNRHTPIKNIPKHSTSYRRLDFIPKGRQLKNKPRR